MYKKFVRPLFLYSGGAVCLVTAFCAQTVLAQSTSTVPQQSGALVIPGSYKSAQEIDQLSNELLSHLDTNPGELNAVLAQASQLLSDRKFDDAVALIVTASEKYPENPDLLVRHAEALAGKNGGSLNGMPFQILSRSLDIDQNHKPSLWLMALFNQQVGNHEAALIILNALKRIMGDESQFVDVVDRSIAVSISYIDHMSSPQGNVEQ